jgi:hypothetical protein
MNLKQIYEKLRQQAERNGHDIDEGRLRQQAWIMRDRMMFEQSFNNNNTSTSSAGAGGGGTLRRNNTSVSNESTLFYNFSNGVFDYFVYNFESGLLTDFNQINMSTSPNITPVTRGGFFLQSEEEFFFISLNGSVVWQDSTTDSSNVDIENFSRYVAAYYLKGETWKLVAFNENSETRSFEFENPIEGGGYSYDDVWNGGFVVREQVDSISKFYIINFTEGTSTLFKQINSDEDITSIYQYAYSDKILTITNSSYFEVFSSSGQKISEFDSLEEFEIESYSYNEFSFLDDNGSFVLLGIASQDDRNVIFFSGVSNEFSYKQVNLLEFGSYRYDINNQKNYTSSRNWIAEGSAIFLFYGDSDEPDDIRYYEEAKILPIWSTDTQLRDFYNLSPNKGINDNLDDSDIAITRSDDYINLLIDNDRDNDTNYSILRFNREGDVTTVIPTDIPKNLELDDDDPINGRTVLQFQRYFTETGTWGWDDLSDVEDRFYYSLRSAADGNFRNLVTYPIDLVMKDIVNNQYWAVRFTDWQQGGGGGFAYTRQLIEGGTFSGDIIAFTHSNWLFSEPDVIVPGVLEIKRGEYGPIYNSAVEDESNGNNPSGTLWNSEYVYNNLYEYLHYIISNDGSVIDSVITSQNYDNEYEGDTYIIEDEIFGKTWISNKQNGGQFQLLPEYYRSFQDNNNTSEETGLRLGNFIISNGFRNRIVTEDSISPVINVPKTGEFINKIDNRGVFHNGAWVLVFDESDANFYFYNINGELIGQKTISSSEWNGYSDYSYGKRCSIVLNKNSGKSVILFNGTSIREIEVESDYNDVSINDYNWWD